MTIIDNKIKNICNERIEVYQKWINQYNEQVQKMGFLYAIEWRIDEVCKATYGIQKIQTLLYYIDKEPEKLHDYLKHEINRITKDFYKGYFVKESTSPMANLIHTWKYQTDGSLVQFYENILLFI